MNARDVSRLRVACLVVFAFHVGFIGVSLVNQGLRSLTPNQREVRVSLVVSHFDEPAVDIQKTLKAVQEKLGTSPRVFIYTKGVYSKELRRVFKSQSGSSGKQSWWQSIGTPYADVLIQDCVNRGREADAYLRFIITNYYLLPDYIIFTRASPKYFESLFLVGLKQFSVDVDVVNLGTTEQCGCDGCFEDDDIMVRVRELYEIATGQICAKSFTSFFSGQFIASRHAIHRQKISFYQELFEMLHQTLEIKPRENNPLFLHVIERLWAPLLGCLEPDAKGVCYKSKNSTRW